MKLAVMSDSHDNIWNLEKALAILLENDAAMIIHCGDFVAPFMLKELEKSGIPVYGVLGNNDGSQYLLTKTALTLVRNITLFDLIGHINLPDYPICFTHQRDVAEGLAYTGRYRLVCYGHSHEYQLETIGNTLLLNPGEIMGKNGQPGFCMVDTDTGTVTRHMIHQ